MRTIIGVVTFGNLAFTQLTLRKIKETTFNEFDFFVVVGKPDDVATRQWLVENKIMHTSHNENRGFPAGINDIYDVAFLNSGAAQVIIAGNDIVPYPGAIDALIDCAENTNWEWICSSQFDARALIQMYPEAAKYFRGPNLIFDDFEAAPWELHERQIAKEIARRAGNVVEPNQLKDVRNLTLFKRSVFDKIGYADVNFWPGGYFEDNDYCRRALLSNVQGCGLGNSVYFHFWSRTIHQGVEGTTTSTHFARNGDYYIEKWGGPFMLEKYSLPFNGNPIKIDNRDNEAARIGYWKSKR
jgi:GT2 family glycosyltransferase